jgi:hypothetical protein
VEDEPERVDPRTHQNWSATLRLAPDVFPILRHVQFEDPLNQTFADPAARLLGAVHRAAGPPTKFELPLGWQWSAPVGR